MELFQFSRDHGSNHSQPLKMDKRWDLVVSTLCTRILCCFSGDGVATISRLLKIIGLFRERAL